jgi:hypothetical protein
MSDIEHLPKPTNIIDFFEKYFDHGEGRERTAFYPSEVTSCTRQVVYKWNGTGKSEPIKGGDWWPMKIGNSVHNMIQFVMHDIADHEELIRAIAWEGFSVDSEVRSGNVTIEGLKRPIRYRLDIIFVDQSGMISGIELKTAYGYGMKDIKENGPKPAALMQAILYLELSGIKRFYIPYVSRDSGDRVLFILDKHEQGYLLRKMFPSGDMVEMARYSPDVYTKGIDRFKEVEKHLDAGTIPDRPYIVAIKNGEMKKDFQRDKIKYKSAWQCNYCSFAAHCWGPELKKYSAGDNYNQVIAAILGGDDEE